MYRENPVKRRLASGGRALGCWLTMNSPLAAEVIGLSGYDCVLIDHEHGPGSFSDTIGMMQAVAASGAVSLMRVPWNDAVYIKRALDTGVEGLMVPSVSSAAEARAAVAACRYPPLGMRGAGFGSARASDYGLRGEHYRDTAADNLLVILQIESAAGVEALPEIAAVPGIDVLFLGPYDLSGSIGKLGRFGDPEVVALIDRAERAILESGLVYGSLPNPLRTTRQLLEAGCRFVLAGCDTSFVRKGALAEVAAFRAAAGEG